MSGSQVPGHVRRVSSWFFGLGSKFQASLYRTHKGGRKGQAKETEKGKKEELEENEEAKKEDAE